MVFPPCTSEFLVPSDPYPLNGLGFLSATSPGGVQEASVGPSLDPMTAVSKISAAISAAPPESTLRSGQIQTLALKICAVKLLDVYLL